MTLGRLYLEAVARLERHNPPDAQIIRDHTSELRREAGGYRIKLREAENEIAYLEGQVDILSDVKGVRDE